MSTITVEDAYNIVRENVNRMLERTGIDKNNPLFIENMKLIISFLKKYSEPRTIERYGQSLVQYIIPYAMKLGKKVYELNEQDLATLYASMEKDKVLTIKASSACINFHRLPLGIPRIDFRRIKYYCPQADFSTQAKFYVDLKPEEIEAIEKNASSLEIALAIELMAYSGLRPGEALGLKWEDLEFTEKEGVTMILARIVHRPGDYGAKGKKGERIVPLSPRAVKFTQYLMRQLEINDIHDPTIASKRIIPFEYSTLVKEFKAAVARAAIPKRDYPISPHKLRHYFAIHYLKLGGSPAELMQLMKISMNVLKVYIQVSGRAVEDAYFNRFYREALEKGKIQKST